MGGRELDNSSNPTTDDAQVILDQAEAELLGQLASVGIPTVYASGSNGATILAGWIARYVAGVLRHSHAAAAGDGGNDDGVDDIRWWDKLFLRIERDPPGVSGMLNGGSVASATIGIGSHATDPVLNLSDNDVAATFKRGEFNF